MYNLLDELTEDDVTMLEAMGFENEDDERITHEELGLTLVKIQGEWFIPREEERDDFMQLEGNWFRVSQYWWEAFDMEQFIANYKKAEVNGTLDEFIRDTIY